MMEVLGSRKRSAAMTKQRTMQLMVALMSRRFVNRFYKSGLVIYEITDTGRRCVGGLPS